VHDRAIRLSLKLFGIPVCKPEFVDAKDPLPIIHWLADQKARGTPAVLHTHSSSALRIARAAMERQIDISGTGLGVSGEPFTPAKGRVVASAGIEAWPKYSATETGTLGRACLSPAEVDEVHLSADKVAVIQRERQVPGGGVGGLFLTGVQAAFPRVMLNVEIGDYATISYRDCGCPAQELGLTTHISGIRSYEKLTSEGVTFLGGELIGLLEEVLPGRFGGDVGDYQLAEDEEEGVSRINVIVSPSVGEVDESAVVETVLETLTAKGFGERRRMQEIWRNADVLRVVRREPLRNGRAKVLPLHILGADRLESGTRVEVQDAGQKA
jgi:phenylacetate-coenzyme A ligase PaaK-like adenylate-forming protein